MVSSLSSSGGGGGLPSGGTFSLHSDVLTANPATPQERTSLIDECKRRGKAAMMAKHYPEADKLYTKALETMEGGHDDDDDEKAVLYCNRATARYSMGKHLEALTDATSSSDCNPSYVKAYWRAGQTLGALKRWEEALERYEKALEVEPTNKAVRKEVDKVKAKWEEERRLMETAGECEDGDGGYMDVDVDVASGKSQTTMTAKATTTTKTSPKPTTTTATTKKKDSTSSTTTTTTTTTDEADEDVQFTKSDKVRGYKIVNGKKTSYFHNEQSEEVKKLIGDIAPKKLDTTSTQNIGSGDAAGETEAGKEASGGGTSAWNKAGTWEEKDVTTWAKESLTKSISDTRYVIPMGAPSSEGSIIRVTKVKDMNGHASFATVRGKRKYIYEFSFKVEWHVELQDEEEASGSMVYPDVDGTCEGEYDVTEYSVDSGSPPSARHLLERFVRNGGLRDEIGKSINGWIDLFKDTYSL